MRGPAPIIHIGFDSRLPVLVYLWSNASDLLGPKRQHAVSSDCLNLLLVENFGDSVLLGRLMEGDTSLIDLPFEVFGSYVLF